jgi:hypothetical protein
VILAGLATIVIPLGLWFVLGLVPALRPAQAWLTPFPSVQNLLSGEMSPVRWAHWFVVLLIWGIGLDVAGYCASAGRVRWEPDRKRRWFAA